MLGINILLILVGQTWAKVYDTGWIQEASCNDTVYAIACDTVDYDSISNAYVVVGHIDPGPLGGLDVLVTKLNADSGTVIWARAYGFPCGDMFDDYGRSVIVDYCGDSVYYVIAGYTKPGFMMIDSADALVFKICATDGSLVWGWLYSGLYYAPQEIRTGDYAYSVVKDGGNYLISGNIEPGPCGGLSDVLVFKVKATTGLMPPPWCWSYAYGKYTSDGGIPKDDYAYSIIEDWTTTPCTLFVVAGKSFDSESGTSDILVFKGRKSNGFLDTTTIWIHDYIPPGILGCAYSIKNDHISGYILTGDIDTSIMVMRLNSDLSVGWNGRCRIYSISNLTSSRCIEPTSDSNYVLTGFTVPGIGVPPGLTDLLVVKIDQNGTILWSNILQGCQNHGTWMTGEDYGQCIIECPPDTYVAVGYTDWPLQSSWNPTNIMVTKMDANGNIPCPQSDTCMENILIVVDTPMINIDTSRCRYEIGMQLIEIADSSLELRDSLICCTGVTAVGEADTDFPKIYCRGNVTNPFTTRTTIYYNLIECLNVQLVVYDLSGRFVTMLVNGQMEAGEHTVIWDGRDENGNKLAPGIYFYKIQAGDYSESCKMIMIK
ncbi:T9SS type A sorting domain-containing protein [candidate division WOR-3 bacterium]|nr:T9SS type A sorting domain-containing protein [candidate division WOR-3 bacterium]